MDSIIDNIFLFQTMQSFSVFDKALETVTQDIVSFDTHVNEINSSIQKLFDNLQVQSLAATRVDGLIGISQMANGNQTDHSERKDTLSVKDSSFLEQAKKYTKVAKGFGNAASEGLDLIESFNELSGTMKKVKTGIKGFKGVLDAIGGIEEIAGATDTISALAAGGEIMAGAEAAATASAAFGPAGWMVGAGILATAGIATAVVMDSEKKHAKPEKQDFFTQGLKEKNLYFVDQQSQNNNIDAITEWSKKKTKAEFDTEVIKTANQLLKNGGDIYFDPRKAVHDPLYIPGLVNALNESSKDHRIKNVLFDNKGDKDAFIQTYDPYQRYPLKMDERVFLNTGTRGMQLDIQEDWEKKKRIDQNRVASLNQYPHFLSEILDRDLKTKISLYLTNKAYDFQAVFKKQFSEYKNSPMLLKGLKENLKSLNRIIEQDNENRLSDSTTYRKTKGDVAMSRGTSVDQRRQITINLNRPMIEHFTITTRDSKESLKDFKHKVEEVLLEILNNVNVN